MLSPTPTFPVAVRIRPRLPGEEGKTVAVSEQSGEVRVIDGSHYFTSAYKSVFTPSHTQQDVFSFVSPYISKVRKGYSVAVLAYGETGSGKTYTMLGSDLEDQRSCGIIPRALRQLYEELAPNIGQGRTYTISASYVLIYNEKLYDLMNPIDVQEPMRVWDDPQCGLLIEGISDTPAPTLSSCLAILRAGEANRLSAGVSTPSHKSHSVLHIKIESGRLCPHEHLHKMKVDFCDLGGSEKDPTDTESMRVSIETLGRVVAVQSSGHESAYIPYRESKLTRLLQHTLEPSCNTCFIATVSPVQETINNTIDTLKCAQKISRIPLNPTKKTIFVNQGILETLKTELQTLRKSLQDSNPATLEDFQDRMLSNGLTVSQVERLLSSKEEATYRISLKPAVFNPGKPSKSPSYEAELEENQKASSHHLRGTSLGTYDPGQGNSRLQSGEPNRLDLAVGETMSISQETTPSKEIRGTHHSVASYGSISETQSLSSVQGNRLGVSSTVRTHRSSASGESSSIIDPFFDQLITNQARSRNEKRTQNLIGVRQVVSTFNRRRQNASAEGINSLEWMKEEDPADREKRQVRIDTELRKLEEEKNQGRKRLEQRLAKDKLEQETFRKKLERKPLIEPRPLRPRNSLKKSAGLLNEGV